MTGMRLALALLVPLLAAAAPPVPRGLLRIASPLTALTIWDDPAAAEQPQTHRARFLPRFRAGIAAEREVAAALEARRRADADAKPRTSMDRADWAQRVAAEDRKLRRAKSRAMERAYDEAVAKFEELEKRKAQDTKPQSRNQYQFVGVVNTGDSADGPISWYARRKPEGARWSVRLVHVDRRAVLKDLYDRGRIDLFARYENTGTVEPGSGRPVVEARYSVRQRSITNLWNFSLKHLFTDSSGMYWRERRLRPGLYTDGRTVYESSYRYRDGRNGMRRLGDLSAYLSRLRGDRRQAIGEQLRTGAPDLVVEE